MSVVLIGYRGSGKTTIGRKLADRLWQKCVDTDELVVKKAGKSIKEIFEQGGEDGFRAIEAGVVREALKLEDHVIALGGGALDREENRQAVKASGHRVIYLKCEPEELLKRIQADPTTAETRPNLTNLGGGIEEIKSMLDLREPVYRSVMTGELEVTYLSPDEALPYIVRLM
jgi:shikimate kinase